MSQYIDSEKRNKTWQSVIAKISENHGFRGHEALEKDVLTNALINDACTATKKVHPVSFFPRRPLRRPAINI